MSNSFLKCSAAREKWLLIALLVVPAFTWAGSDFYEVYLNKTLLLKQYVGKASPVMDLQLDKAQPNDRLYIIYSHCGITGTGRNMAIKNEKNQLLKEWKYADASGTDLSMSIPVKEIRELQKKNPDAILTLVYSSAAQLPGGRMLAAIKPAHKSISGMLPQEQNVPPALAVIWGGLVFGLAGFRRVKM